MTRSSISSVAHPSRAHVSSETLLQRIAEKGLFDHDVAAKALRLTLSVVGQRLTDDEAAALASSLPNELARVVEASDHDEFTSDLGADELYDRVRRREKVPAGIAREHVNIVLQVLGSALEDDVRQRLVRGLPRELGQQLLPSSYGEPPPYATGAHAPPLNTLASGRPGSRHPVSEAAPDRAHAHSVARNASPHSETKLSSSHGLTQERHRESLASGHPPAPLRPIAEADDE